MKSFFKLFSKSNQRLPKDEFHSEHYLRHNARRLEHLASLNISIRNTRVLELGAGIGDHTHYYLDRNNEVTLVEARTENIKYLRARYTDNSIYQINLENPTPIQNSPFEHVHCYGLLYHLKNPGHALKFISDNCCGTLFLETCVSFGEEERINQVKENVNHFSQSFSGTGCRPTRIWIFNQLKRYFKYVYIPKTQPNHEEFPIDWSNQDSHKGLSRAIYVSSRTSINNDLLSTTLLTKQSRHT